MGTIDLPAGTIHYDEVGSGRPVVCVHGYLMGGDLWAELGSRLAERGLRCIMPTWPLGAHASAMKPGTDLTPRGVAAIIADFLEALDLRDVVLVGNDTGGALSQVVAVDHPDRLGAVVLTNCDAFDNFPPSFFKALVKAAKVPGGLKAALAGLRSATVRKSPLGYGLLSHGDVDHLAKGWAKNLLGNADVLEDLRRFTLGLDPEVTEDAARRLSGFDKPVLLAWATDDKLFPLEHARRLAEILPDARVETIAGSRTFSMIDQPDRLAALVADFALAGRPREAIA
jgi:pimeloyl-ACP methyl ester carboxylesterase